MSFETEGCLRGSINKIHMYNKNVRRTTREAARLVGISRVTLQRWIAAGKVVAPKPTLIGAKGVRLWGAVDIAALSEIKKTIYRKGRGRKRRSRQMTSSPSAKPFAP